MSDDSNGTEATTVPPCEACGKTFSSEQMLRVHQDGYCTASAKPDAPQEGTGCAALLVLGVIGLVGYFLWDYAAPIIVGLAAIIVLVMVSNTAPMKGKDAAFGMLAVLVIIGAIVGEVMWLRRDDGGGDTQQVASVATTTTTTERISTTTTRRPTTSRPATTTTPTTARPTTSTVPTTTAAPTTTVPPPTTAPGGPSPDVQARQRALVRATLIEGGYPYLADAMTDDNIDGYATMICLRGSVYAETGMGIEPLLLDVQELWPGPLGDAEAAAIAGTFTSGYCPDVFDALRGG